MNTLTELLKESPALSSAGEKLHKGDTVSIYGCSESSKAGIIATLKEGFRSALIIVPNDIRARALQKEYAMFDRKVCVYPAKDLMFYQADIRGNELTIERMKCLRRIMEGKPVTVITTMDSLMTPQIPHSVLYENVLKISGISEINEKELASKLVMMGYNRSFQVENPGEFSIRGGIIDIFELTEENPYRIELWGDSVDSIRSFDIQTQRSIENLSSVSICPASDMILSDGELEKGIERIGEEAAKFSNKLRKEFLTEEAHRVEVNFRTLREEAIEFRNTVNLDSYIRYFFNETETLLDMFDPSSSVIFMDEPLKVGDHATAVEYEFRENMSHRLEKGYILPGQADILMEVEKVSAEMASFPLAHIEELALNGTLKSEYLVPKAKFAFDTKHIQSYNRRFDALIKDLGKYRKDGYRVLILSGSRTRAVRLAEDLTDNGVSAFFSEDPSRELLTREIETYHGFASKGFEIPDLKLAVISETDIFGAERRAKKNRKIYDGEKFQDFNELRVGDYVVHEYHGLGIYRGIEQIAVEGVVKDYMKIEYRDGGNLYVPATEFDVLSKYASAEASTPKLNKLGTQEWVRTKDKVKRATEEIAKDLVELYAKRQSAVGYRYDPDTVWQKEFEEMFPFEETDDQLAAIEETKKDMESTKVMDRLICGDVGFGKTEIAIRAAFKAVQEGKQVVYLVPTTILAQQHFDTFKERMKDYPMRIALLSRFCSAGEIKKTITDLRKGMVDIVIGTHRVLSKDVEFKDLGLLVIDEEQRFGVTHKEKIKKIRENVDVLTLTATPIPRTLHMSLIGIRDMSLLTEAPNDRQPIQTYVLEYNEEMVREAIVRELARRGQVYYVYNRVNNIEQITEDLRELVPEARIAFAHGQMAEKELEYIMYQFINHEIDVLVSTTIIETGMDISNVNTMIIHDSDRLGLSQLYQLRGRVGRSNRTAYAFLMYRRDRLLKEEAEKRLSAIREYTALGSGYKIAMKDLEIRGAGNILGRSQHGHMQAVGYDLYCKMLNEAVRTMKGIEVAEDFDTRVDIDVDAFVPDEYIANEIQKLDIYKKIAGIETREEMEDVREELLDRFGSLPTSAENLLRISLIRASAHKLSIGEITSNESELIFKVRKDASLNPDGVITLFKKYEKLSFSNKSYEFIHKIKKTGLIEKDEKELISLTESIIEDMLNELLI